MSILLIIGIILAVVFLIIPELSDSISSLVSMIPSYAAEVESWWEALSERLVKYGVDLPQFDFNTDKLIEFLKDGGTAVINTTLSATTSIVTAVINFVLALAFSIYVLAQKETLKRQSKKVLARLMKPEKMQKLLDMLDLINRTFTNFITGQLTEAVIIGILCFIGMSIFLRSGDIRARRLHGAHPRVRRVYRNGHRRVPDTAGKTHPGSVVCCVHHCPSAV